MANKIMTSHLSWIEREFLGLVLVLVKMRMRITLVQDLRYLQKDVSLRQTMILLLSMS